MGQKKILKTFTCMKVLMPEGLELQSALSPILTGVKAHARREELRLGLPVGLEAVDAAQPKQLRCIATHSLVGGNIFLHLHRYQPGASRELVVEDDESPHQEVQTVQAPANAKGKPSHFVDCNLYACCFKNVLVICESQALRSWQLEEHLTWLLQQKNILTAEQQVSLDGRTDHKLYLQAETEKIRQITVSGATVQTGLQGPQATADSPNLTVIGGGWTALQDFVDAGSDRLKGLVMQKALEPESTKTSLTFTFDARESAQKLALAMLNEFINHRPDGRTVKVKLRKGSGSGSNLDDFTLRTTKNIPVGEKGLNVISLAQEMSSWLATLSPALEQPG